MIVFAYLAPIQIPHAVRGLILHAACQTINCSNKFQILIKHQQTWARSQLVSLRKKSSIAIDATCLPTFHYHSVSIDTFCIEYIFSTVIIPRRHIRVNIALFAHTQMSFAFYFAYIPKWNKSRQYTTTGIYVCGIFPPPLNLFRHSFLHTILHHHHPIRKPRSSFDSILPRIFRLVPDTFFLYILYILW